MSQSKMNTDDIGKTGTLIALGNTLLAPLYWVDAKLGITAALATTAAFLYIAHEEGKQKRPVQNFQNRANSFFGGFTGDESTSVSNALENIYAGGGSIFDQMTAPLNNPK